MGGLATEVTAATRRVLLESAHFDRSTVRRTAKRLGLHTDASHRFERGTDPEGTVAALDRAAVLLAEIAGAVVRRGVARRGRSGAFSLAARSRSRRGASMVSPVSPTTAPISRVGSPASASRCSTPAPTPGRCGCRAGVDSTSSAPKTSTRRRCAFAASTRSLPALSPIYGSDGPETPVQKRRRLVRRHLVGQGFAETIQFVVRVARGGRALPAGEDQREGAGRSGRRRVRGVGSGRARQSALRAVHRPAPLDASRPGRHRALQPAPRRRRRAPVRDRATCSSTRRSSRSGWSSAAPTARRGTARAKPTCSSSRACSTRCSRRSTPRSRSVGPSFPACSPAPAPSSIATGEWVGWFGRLDHESPVPLFAAELFCHALGDGAAVSRVDDAVDASPAWPPTSR